MARAGVAYWNVPNLKPLFSEFSCSLPCHACSYASSRSGLVRFFLCFCSSAPSDVTPLGRVGTVWSCCTVQIKVWVRVKRHAEKKILSVFSRELNQLNRWEPFFYNICQVKCPLLLVAYYYQVMCTFISVYHKCIAKASYPLLRECNLWHYIDVDGHDDF